MTLYQEEGGKKRSIKGMFLNIMKNPLVVGVTAGVVVLAVRSLIPRNVTGELVFSLQNQIGFAFSVVQNLAKISTPLILICLGGQCVLTGDALISGKTAFCVMWRNFFAPGDRHRHRSLAVQGGSTDVLQFCGLCGTDRPVWNTHVCFRANHGEGDEWRSCFSRTAGDLNLCCIDDQYFSDRDYMQSFLAW